MTNSYIQKRSNPHRKVRGEAPPATPRPATPPPNNTVASALISPPNTPTPTPPVRLPRHLMRSSLAPPRTPLPNDAARGPMSTRVRTPHTPKSHRLPSRRSPQHKVPSPHASPSSPIVGNPNPNGYEVLPFLTKKPPSLNVEKSKGLKNHPYSQEALKKHLSISSANLMQLFKVMEPMFDDEIDPKPVSAAEFRWFDDIPDAADRSFNDLPFPAELVGCVIAKHDMRLASVVEEIGYLMHGVTIAAKKRVDRRTQKSKVRKIVEDMVSLRSGAWGCVCVVLIGWSGCSLCWPGKWRR